MIILIIALRDDTFWTVVAPLQHLRSPIEAFGELRSTIHHLERPIAAERDIPDLLEALHHCPSLISVLSN
ncbi:hypothetical protein E3N88_21122 [Mikania micrantha]|uniref:Uncharacterized protein n=1 Tax=Mikania micrantha TaxID=192012 RepID=A0A5N6NKC2_9ASTR|nr:hypothetical protein E3N88_21122 [Mikania micrantha]